MFDSHCHLNFKAFRDDADTVAAEMAATGVSGLVIGCDRHSSQDAIALAARHPNLWAAVGLHPIHVFDDPWDMTVMRQLAQSDRVVAIGEVGLDFYRFPEDQDRDQYIAAQYETFRQAIALAKELDKPLVIHSRQAYDEIITVLKEHGPLRGTVHCFMGTPAQAKALLALGFHLGFTGVITYPDIDPGLRDVVRTAPLDRLLIETDAPYLTPEPHRTAGKQKTGKTPRNLPAYTAAVAETIGKERGLTTETVITQTEINTRRLFNLPELTHA